LNSNCSAQAKRPFVFHVFRADWPQLVPNEKYHGYSQSNAYADGKKPAVRRESNQKNYDDCDGNCQPSGAFERNTGMRLLIGLHIGLL
jgi:hypothetical protein